MADDRPSSRIGGPAATSVAAPPGLTASDTGFDPTLTAGSPPLAGDGGAAVAILPAIEAPPLENVVPAIAAGDPFRARLVQRLLEIVPGLVSWLLILSPLLLSFRFPEVVAWFVLTFDFYWLYKAVVVTGSVCVAFGRVRQTTAADWRTRSLALADPGARLAEIDRLEPLIRNRVAELRRGGERLAATGGRRELDRLERERRDLDRPARSRRLAAARPAPALPRGLDPDLHRAVREAVRDGPRPRRGRLPARPADGRDHHPRDRPRGPQERRPAARPVRRPVRPFLPHPRPARARHRRRQELGDGLWRALAVPRDRPAWLRPRRRRRHRPRLGLPRPSAVLRLPDLDVPHRARPLPAAVPADPDVPQQPVGHAAADPARRGRGDPRPDVALADPREARLASRPTR